MRELPSTRLHLRFFHEESMARIVLCQSTSTCEDLSLIWTCVRLPQRRSTTTNFYSKRVILFFFGQHGMLETYSLVIDGALESAVKFPTSKTCSRRRCLLTAQSPDYDGDSKDLVVADTGGHCSWMGN